MKSIQDLGRSHFYTEAEDGQVIFSTDLEEGRLDIYLDGFAFGENELMCKVFYCDILVLEVT